MVSAPSRPRGRAGARLCSDGEQGPIAGTARSFRAMVAIEWPGPWPRDATGREHVGEGLARLPKETGAVLQLIRRVGRAGHRDGGPYRVYLAFPEEAVVETLLVADPAELLGMDLSAPGRVPGASRVGHPLLFVCAHGKRDRCCAIKGRPVAKALDERFPAGWVWETTHLKGHRFAATSVLLPWGYSYGQLNAEAGAALLGEAAAGRLFLGNNRGRGTLKPAEQAAELAVAERLAAEGIRVAPGEIRVSGERAWLPGGRSWRVAVEKREVTGVIASCGQDERTEKVPVVVALEEEG